MSEGNYHLRERLVKSSELHDEDPELEWTEKNCPSKQVCDKNNGKAGFRFSENRSYYDILKDKIYKPDSYFICDQNRPVGFICADTAKMRTIDLLDDSYYVFDIGDAIVNNFEAGEELDIVKEIYLVSFQELNNVTVVKDTLKLVDKLLTKYDLVLWSCVPYNDIQKTYDKLIKRFKGFREEMPNGISLYCLIRGISSIPDAYLR